MSSFLMLSEGDTRNRWRDGQVCLDVGQGIMAPWARRPGRRKEKREKTWHFGGCGVEAPGRDERLFYGGCGVEAPGRDERLFYGGCGLKQVFLVCSEMSDNEQRGATKFCFRLGHNATETFAKSQQAYEGSVLSRVQGFGWFKAFSEGRKSIEDEPRNGRPSVSKPAENVVRVRDLVLGIRSSLDSQNDWGRVEFESHHRSSDFDQ
ncbi:HTH_48 domain-containing protein [Trichonephila clavipes]|nr:HTH_48 domain-containing protein [Trichonephila clavipes]